MTGLAHSKGGTHGSIRLRFYCFGVEDVNALKGTAFRKNKHIMSLMSPFTSMVHGKVTV